MSKKLRHRRKPVQPVSYHPIETRTPSGIQMQREEVSFSVPLPPPGVLREYETLVPDFAKDLHKEVQRESKHRRSNENWLVKGTVLSGFLAQFSALGLCAFVMYLAYLLAMADKTVVASIVGGLDIVALAAVFLGTSLIKVKNQHPTSGSQLQITDRDHIAPAPSEIP